MSTNSRDRAVIGALVVAESAWLFALLGIIGVGMGAHGSPLGWLAVLALMAAGALSTRVISALPMGGLLPYVIQIAAGATAIYLTISTQVGGSEAFWDLAWPRWFCRWRKNPATCCPRN